MTNRNDSFGLKEGDTYIGTDGHHHHFHEGLKEGDLYVGTDGHHHRYVDVASVHRKPTLKSIMNSLFKKKKETSNDIDYSDRHKGLKEGQLYVGSDGHHHHYHAKRDYHDSSEDFKRHSYKVHKRRQMLSHVLFTTLSILALVIICYLIYIYSVD